MTHNYQNLTILEDARSVIEQARAEGAEEFYALVSGGKDSLTVADVAHRLGVLNGIIYVDTTIRVAETLEHVKNTAQEQGWPEPIVLTAKRDYTRFVEKYGFPRAATHSWVFNELKWKPLRDFRRETKDRSICFLSGVRRKESRRRMGTVKRVYRDPSDSTGRMLWAAPLIDQSTPQVLEYLKERGIAISPAYSKIGISGDCLCGAYSRSGEAELIARHYPEVAVHIAKLERSVAHRVEQRTWGNGSTIRGAQQQQSIEEYACFDCVMSD